MSNAQTLSPQQKLALNRVIFAVLDTIVGTGKEGAKSTVMYAAMMAQGATLNQFQSLMGSLVKKGLVFFEDEKYFITDAGTKHVDVLRGLVKPS